MIPGKSSKTKIEPEPVPRFKQGNDQEIKKELYDAINRLNAKTTELAPGKTFTNTYLALIKKAQSETLNKNWYRAYQALWEAVFMVNRGVECRNNFSLARNLVFTPLLTFLALYIISMLIQKLPPVSSTIAMSDYLGYMITGALGGTTITLWGIVKHTILLDFDDQYILWYWLKPALGAIFGLVTVLILQAGLISLQLETPNIPNTLPLHVFAFLGGFSERFFIRLIDRVMTALFGGEQQKLDPDLFDTELDETATSAANDK